jgi:hypothetical protein
MVLRYPINILHFTANKQNIIYHGKLRLIAYVLVFLHAFLAVFLLNANFALAQNTIQVSESAQKPEKPQISLTPAERAWLAQNHTVWVRVFEYPPFIIVDADGPKGISIDYLKLSFERTGINYKFRVETRSFGEALKSLIALKGPDLLPSIVPAIEREPHVAFTQIYYSSPNPDKPELKRPMLWFSINTLYLYGGLPISYSSQELTYMVRQKH